MTGVTGKMKGSLPNPLGRTFGLVHGDQHGNHSNTQTGEDAAHDEEGKREGSGLHGDTGGEDEDGEDDRPSPTEEICGGGGKESTEESTGGQDGDDEGLLGGGDGARSGGVGFAKGTQPILHGLDTGNDTGIITEEDTTEGGEEGLQRGRWSESGGGPGVMEKVETNRENTSPNVPGCVGTDAGACSGSSSSHGCRGSTSVGWGTTCTLGGREGGETGARTMDRRREDGSILYRRQPQARKAARVGGKER